MKSNFDPFTQNITFRDATQEPIYVPVGSVDFFYQYCIRICINYGTQLGASMVLFVILLLLTRPDKRRSSVFLLNCTALILNVGRLVCQVIYFTSEFVRLYAYFGHDFSRVPLSAYVDSVLGVVLVTLLLICIEVSLVLQAHVVCANLRRRYRNTLLAVSIFLALVPMVFRFIFMVRNCWHIMDASETLHLNWLESVTNAVFTASICFFCLVFITKLGFAIHLRKRLGMQDFGPMKVIFVMGCQTMIIPAVLSILQYLISVPELASNIFTLVTISLPLSSIWAGFTIDQRTRTSAATSRNNLFNALSFTNDGKSRQASTVTYASAPSSKTNTVCYAEMPPAKDKYESELTHGISVERDISVHSCRKDAESPA